jgi:protein phosphatase
VSRGVVAHGETHPGEVRRNNEDAFLIDPELGLYLVLDGMGGHSAGDVASALARDAIREHVASHRGRLAGRELITAALRTASNVVHQRARGDRALHGMGTTAVACLAIDPRRALIAHVGDSRAYLLRDGRLRLLTTDHTVVAELVARGGLSLEEAERHPYKSVLSRNLGARPDTNVDVLELELAPGDRVLLCSDGLNGFATNHAIEQVLAGAVDPRRAALDLIELALRGGGGDNVSCVVLETEPRVEAESTLVLRKHAAVAWWSRRERFLAEARAAGVASSPLCAVMSPDEAIGIFAGNLFEAVSHDLEQSTGIHVWTFAENLASGWFDQGGGYGELRDVLDRLGRAADAVIGDVAAQDHGPGLVLEAVVVRALTVAEMALAAAVGERLRLVEEELATSQGDDTLLRTLVDQRVITMDHQVLPERPAPGVIACLDAALAQAEAQAARPPAALEARTALAAIHRHARDGDAGIDVVARELFDGRALTEGALGPVIAVLDRARRIHLAAAREAPASDADRAQALIRLVTAHQTMAAAVAVLVCDAAAEGGDGVRELTRRTARLRADLSAGESRISRLERRLRSGRGAGDPTTEHER